MSDEELALAALKDKIQEERGFNCQFYKDKCLRRRLAVRMRARGSETFGDYSRLLDRDSGEYEMLLDTLTINVTKFFRNAEAWAVIRDTVVPALFETGRDAVRIWSAGCASGEEPYSVSILLREYAEATGRTAELSRFRILGTDIDRRSLDAARRAEFQDLSLVETPPEQKERWFSPGPPYRLDQAVREQVSFVRKDLISGIPERGQDLILCRNVIIYFDREIQEQLFQRFYDALVPGGYLVLGKVETLLGPARAEFQAVSNRERVFRKPL